MEGIYIITSNKLWFVILDSCLVIEYEFVVLLMYMNIFWDFFYFYFRNCLKIALK